MFIDFDRGNSMSWCAASAHMPPNINFPLCVSAVFIHFQSRFPAILPADIPLIFCMTASILPIRAIRSPDPTHRITAFPPAVRGDVLPRDTTVATSQTPQKTVHPRLLNHCFI